MVELIQCPQNVKIIEEVQENWFPAWKEFSDTIHWAIGSPQTGGEQAREEFYCTYGKYTQQRDPKAADGRHLESEKFGSDVFKSNHCESLVVCVP